MKDHMWLEILLNLTNFDEAKRILYTLEKKYVDRVNIQGKALGFNESIHHLWDNPQIMDRS